MVHLYVPSLVGEGEDGVVVKIEGHGYINQQTGQITTRFRKYAAAVQRIQIDVAGG